MRGAILQLTSSDDPLDNFAIVKSMLSEAASGGAEFVFTPEVTNCVSLSRPHQKSVLRLPNDDDTLAGLCDAARQHKVWLLLGSMAVKTNDSDGRFANRSYVINSDGQIVAHYDKIHMFDVDINENESFRESNGYRPGTRAVLAPTPWGNIGLTICYDMRFPELYQRLAEAGARIFTVPAAFSPVTGAAHWHSLLRARAIETGSFVIAPAQTGKHPSSTGKTRSTYGHSLVVAPWGEILLDADVAPGVYPFDLDLEKVNDARSRVPSLHNRRPFDGP